MIWPNGWWDMTLAVTPPLAARYLGVLALAWLPAGVVGWLLHGVWAGSGDAAAGIWLTCALIVIGIGLILTRALRVKLPHHQVLDLAGMVVVGWGIANAAGWSLGVEIGGPATGLVTGVVVAASTVRAPLPGVAVVAVLGLVGLVAWRVVAGDGIPVWALIPALLGGLVAAAVARLLVVPALPLLPIVVLTTAGGVAWVGSWAVNHVLVSPVSVTVSIAAEIVSAMALGAVALGFATRSRTGEPVWKVVLRWLTWGGLAAVASIAAAQLLRSFDPGATSPVHLLDVTTTVGLAVAAWFAVRPTLVGMSSGQDEG